MYPREIDLLARRERYKDLLREVADQRLARTARKQQPNNRMLYQRVVHWLGTQMVRWGCKLQQRGSTALCCLAASCKSTAGSTNMSSLPHLL